MTVSRSSLKRILALASALTVFTAAGLHAQSADEAAIRRVIAQHYLEGRRLADATVLGDAFVLGSAHMFFVQNDTLTDVPIPAYVRRIASARNDPSWKAGGPSTARVTLVDISGKAAVAKIEDPKAYPNIVDYMILLKVRGHWKVVSKAFDRVPAAR